jgi:lipopolysaccharide heptosyltransferase II
VLSIPNKNQQQNVTAEFRVSTQAPSILLLRLSSLGDIVLTTPLIAALREQYPTSRIELVISKEYESLIPAIQGLSNVHVFDKSTGVEGLRALRQKLIKEEFDHVLDLHNVHRTRILRKGLGKHIAIINKRTLKRWLLVKSKIDRLKNEPDVIGRYFETAASLGIKDSEAGPKLHVNSMRENTRIAIAPGSRHWNKRWPAPHFAIVASELIARGYHIDLHGSSEDSRITKEIAKDLPAEHVTDFAGKLNLLEATEKISEATLIISNDSGLAHIAEAVGTKVIAVFGPTVKQFGFAPRSADAIVLEVEGLYCRPCTAIGLDHCPEKHFRCMKEIEPDRVLHQLELMILN